MIFSFMSLRTPLIVCNCSFRTFLIIVARVLKEPSSHQLLSSKRKDPFGWFFIFRCVLISWRNIFVLRSIPWRFEPIAILGIYDWNSDNIFIWNKIQLAAWNFLDKIFWRVWFFLYSGKAFVLLGVSRKGNLLFFIFLLGWFCLLFVIIIKHATIF